MGTIKVVVNNVTKIYIKYIEWQGQGVWMHTWASGLFLMGMLIVKTFLKGMCDFPSNFLFIDIKHVSPSKRIPLESE
jgi:hypothetical protein